MDQTLNLKIDGFGKAKAKLICLLVADGLSLADQASETWKSTGRDLSVLAKAASFEAKKSSFLNVFAPDGLDADHVLLAGVG